MVGNFQYENEKLNAIKRGEVKLYEKCAHKSS